LRAFAAVAVAAILLLNALGIAACGSAGGYRVSVFLATRPHARLTSAVNQLMVGDDVRIGRARVGQISGIKSTILPSGIPAARTELTFDPSVKHLPVDTFVRVCPKSANRHAYLQLTPGSSRRVFPNGGLIPLAQVGARPVC
jgi:ABC-type transporter Mla subunit MlaD